MMVLLATIEVFGMLEAENGEGPHLPTWRGMTNHYHTFYIPEKCHFSTTSPCSSPGEQDKDCDPTYQVFH
jgi:hypothetical protein